MTVQTSLFDAMPQIGDWVTEHGEELTFEQLTQMIGNVVVWDCSTESRKLYKLVQIERVYKTETARRIVYNDGRRTPGICAEFFFQRHKGCSQAHAYRVAGE